MKHASRPTRIRMALLLLGVLLLAHAMPAAAQHKTPTRNIRRIRRAVALGLPADAFLTRAPDAPAPGAAEQEPVAAPALSAAAAKAHSPNDESAWQRPYTELPAAAAADAASADTATAAGVAGAPAGAALPAGVSAAVVSPAAVTASATSLCGARYLQTNLRPLRAQWNSSYGYCGEASVQMVALARGVWIGQRQARIISTGGTGTDVILMGRNDPLTANLFKLMRDKLGWNATGANYWDGYNQTGSSTTLTPSPLTFLGWVKKQIMEGRPVITAMRLQDVAPDPWYDHIVPLFGVCTDATTPTNVVNTNVDVFSMTTDLKDDRNRSASDPGMFAKYKACPYSYDRGEVGCIPSNKYPDLGYAMDDIKDTARLTVRTTRLYINGWSNGFDAQQEPGEFSAATGNSVTAKYSLLLYNLTVGRSYTTYRIPKALPTIPTTKTALVTACGSPCKSVTFNATASAVTLNEASALGAFPANSVQYFLTVAN